MMEGAEFPLHRACHKGHSGEHLSKAVMEGLPYFLPFLNTDFNNLAFQHFSLRNVLCNSGKTDDLTVYIFQGCDRK